MKRTMVIAVVSCVVAIATMRVVPAQSPPRPAGTTKGEWPSYHGDQAQSPLLAARRKSTPKTSSRSKSPGGSRPTISAPRPEYKLEGTPLMVGGVVYTTAGTRRSVVALDAATGELRWVHGEREGRAWRRCAAAAVGPRRRLLDRRPGRTHPLRHARVFGWSRSTPRPARRSPASARTASIDLKAAPSSAPASRSISVNGEIGLHSTPAVGERCGDRRIRVPRRAARRRRTTTPKASCRRSTCGPASGCGTSTPFRALASSATTPGRTTRGRSTATPACGTRSRR